jgi:hypothetical protein
LRLGVERVVAGRSAGHLASGIGSLRGVLDPRAHAESLE